MTMKTITVKGTGRVQVKPDLIVVTLRLATEDKEYGKAMELAAEKIDMTSQALESIGFEKGALKTTDFNVHTKYESVRDKDGSYKSMFKGYECSHSLKTEFDFDTKLLAKVLSTISRCLTKPELSVSFTMKNPTTVGEELLKSAAKNAKEKAEILCAASGVKLGELVSVAYDWNEINVFSDTDYKVESRCMMKAEASLSNIDIQPDDIKTSDSATFVWEIV